MSREKTRSEWGISYTQSDLDMIREQILNQEASKRRSLVLGLFVALGALGLAVFLTITSYGLYVASESEKSRLAQENAALKARAEQSQKQLDTIAEQEANAAQARDQAQSRLNALLPSILNSTASSSEVANFAKMVYNLPQGRIEVDRQPPNTLFRNWRVSTATGTEVYTLVGGFADGKWVIYANLLGKS